MDILHSTQLQMQQQLHMTPQLQLSLRVLMMGQQELNLLLDEELLSNPLLEELPNEQGFASHSFEYTPTAPISLAEHLTWQAHMSDFTPEELSIAHMLIGNLDSDGFLAQDCFPLPHAHEYVRQQLMRLDPVGCLSANMQECLLTQLAELGYGPTSFPYRLLKEHFAELYRHQWNTIQSALQVTADAIEQALHMIARLDPKPGHSFELSTHSPHAMYVFPDVDISFTQGHLMVQVVKNRQFVLTQPFATAEEKAKAFLQDKYKAASWLLQSLQQREHTLAKVTQAIVDHQQQWLLQKGGLQPLTLQHIATQLGIHVSTVSRATSGKYAQTPRGLISLKSLFSSTSMSIKERIQELVAAEDPYNPLSDEQLTERLQEHGIAVARRTVAKYREQLKILPIGLRKMQRL